MSQSSPDGGGGRWGRALAAVAETLRREKGGSAVVEANHFQRGTACGF